MGRLAIGMRALSAPRPRDAASLGFYLAQGSRYFPGLPALAPPDHRRVCDGYRCGGHCLHLRKSRGRRPPPPVDDWLCSGGLDGLPQAGGRSFLRPAQRKIRPMRSNADDDTFRVVCLGGSAGGLQAYLDILDGVPADTGMAFVIAPHRALEHARLL